MDIFIIAAVVGIVIVGGSMYFLLKNKGSEPIKEESSLIEEPEEEELPFKVEEETEEGCPDRIKKLLLKEQEKIEKEAYKVYLVVNNLFKNKNLPAEVKKEFEIFLRSYNRIRELKEEIEVYPFSDCYKVFHLKFNFYRNLIQETTRKLVAHYRSK